MEVLKKMMHHHAFTLLPVSGGRRRVSVCVCLSSVSSCMDVWDDGYVNIECVRVCVRACENADTTFKYSQGLGVGGGGCRHYSFQPSVREPISI